MYVNNPDAKYLTLVLETEEDKKICRRALGAAWAGFAATQRIEFLPLPGVVDEDISEGIARGLAKIALGQCGESGFSGLDQVTADRVVAELYGSPGDYIDDRTASHG